MFVSRFSDIRRKILVHLCIVSLIQTPKLIVTSWSILLCYNSLWYTVMWQFCCFVSWSLPTFLLEFLLSAVLSELPLILCFFLNRTLGQCLFFLIKWVVFADEQVLRGTLKVCASWVSASITAVEKEYS